MKKIFLILFVLALTSCVQNNKKENVMQDTTLKKTVVVPEFNADTAYSYVAQQLAFGPRVPESEAHAVCAAWFVTTFNRLADTVYVQEFRTRLYDGRGIDGKNIIATFNPDVKKRIVLASHWDSRPFADHDSDEANWNTPIDGANDGASGVGILMEVARVLKNQPLDENIGIDIVLFDLEDYGAPDYLHQMDNESWALGSQYWSKHPHKSGYRAYFGILLDMVGAANPKFPKEYYSQQLAAHVSNKVWKIAREIGYDEYFINELGNPINDDHIYMNTVAGIPTIDIIHLENESVNGSFYEHWHTLNDNLKQIDTATLKMVGTVVLNVIYNE